MPSQPQEFLTRAKPAADCPRLTLAQDTLHRFGQLRFRATGGSMWPAIMAGDVLEFRSCTATQLQPGQIALIGNGDRLVAHRVVAVNAVSVATRGDALAADDPPSSPHKILGVLVAQQRGRAHLHPGGRHWRLRQRLARWLVRRSAPARSLFARMPALARLVA